MATPSGNRYRRTPGGRALLGGGRRRGLRHYLLTLLGASAMTLTFFLVLPLIQAITKPADNDMLVRQVDTTSLPPPPAPPEPEPPKQDEPDPPPELEQDTPQLDLAQLELALNPSVGGGWSTADFAIDLDFGGAGDSEEGGLFSLAELDQTPRVIFQQNPTITPQIRKKAPGTVYVVYTVDETGRVLDPRIQDSPDPCFDRSALEAIRRWKYEPGKRNGKPVRFRVRQPITFPGQ